MPLTPKPGNVGQILGQGPGTSQRTRRSPRKAGCHCQHTSEKHLLGLNAMLYVATIPTHHSTHHIHICVCIIYVYCGYTYVSLRSWLEIGYLSPIPHFIGHFTGYTMEARLRDRGRCYFFISAKLTLQRVWVQGWRDPEQQCNTCIYYDATYFKLCKHFH